MKKGPQYPAAERVKALVDEGSDVSVNYDVKATSYIRSGKELLRSANNYHEDGHLENALVLYTRFLTIFLERLREHPDYKNVPAPEKKIMQSHCLLVLPKAEALREQLRIKYEAEHEEYLVQQMLAVQLQEKSGSGREARSISNFGQNSAGSNTQDQNQKNWVLDNSWRPSKDHSHAPVPGDLQPHEVPAPSAPYSDVELQQERPAPLPDHYGGAGVHPSVDRSCKPSRFLSPMTSGLREVIVPGDLIPTFLKCAEKNTNNNIETCGFLTGRILGGKLVITDLIIPKQDGTSDSCTAKGDEEYLVIQDNLNLITFGWIHTHPSQTAFLSSVDMHSQYCYQQMMPEAIAIVCSPKKNQVGTFTLNPVEGMEMIGNCPHTTGFHTHPHTSVPLFIDATHHTFDTTKRVSVHDLRYT